MPSLALIGLGSNLGDRKAHLDRAVMTLAETPGLIVRGVSLYEETPPVGGPAGQGAFLNAAAAVECAIEPSALLETLNAVESLSNRIRNVHWGERTLDLDMLLFGDAMINTPRLLVPHPRMAFRRFVLAPAAAVAPSAVDPVTGRTVLALLANIDRRPGYVAPACSPKLLWRHVFGLISANDLEALDASHFFKGEGVELHARMRTSLPAVAIEDRIALLERELPHPLSILTAVGGGEATDLILRAAEWLDAEACSALTEDDGWLISHFWFDSLFLGLDSLKSTRPRYGAFVDRFLEARARVLQPTFVVARPSDRERFGLHDPRYAWRRPVGWDTPILFVDDFDSDASLAEILATCQATRAGGPGRTRPAT